MKRSPSRLLMIVLLLLTCSCARHASLEASRPDASQPQEVKPDDPVIKAATPEDPGPMATVVMPLGILKAEAKPLPAKPEAEVSRESLPIDHPVYIQPGKARHFLHNVFSVKKHAQFAFLVPPHQGNTRLRGNFRSFTKRGEPDATSDRTADLDLMLLNGQEFNEFLRGGAQSVTYELDPAHNQLVDWHIPVTYGQSEEYHLVFSNADGATKIKFVEADFTVSFE